jgi:spore germination protein GerM
MLNGCIANGNSIESAGVPETLQQEPAQTTPASNAPLETTQASSKVPVYWIGRNGNDVALHREFRDNPGEENPITTALRAMMSEKPLDHDFFTPWQEPKDLATSISGKSVVTVDISRDAFNSNLDAGMAQLAVQQLVYTATAAAASSGLIDSGQQIQVVILVDGHKDFMGFGQVKLGGPMVRDVSKVAPVWIVDPQEDLTLAGGPVKFNGRATVEGAKLKWQLLREAANGEKAAYIDGETTASAVPGQGGSFSFSVSLGKGRYELKVTMPAQGGDAASTDTRVFNVG